MAAPDIFSSHPELDADKSYLLSSYGNHIPGLGDGKSYISAKFLPLRWDYDLKNFKPYAEFLQDFVVEIKLEIDYLCFLPVGSLISKNKVYQSNFEKASLKIEGLGFEDESFPWEKKVQFRDLGHLDFNKTLKNKPFESHPYATCMTYFDTSNHSRYVIPSIEIIRFHFCHSSNLTEALFRGRLEEQTNGINRNERIFSPETTSRKNLSDDGTDFVKLGKKIPNSDIRTVAKIALDDDHFRSAFSIGKSIRINLYNMEKYYREKNYKFSPEKFGYPFTVFPYNESAELEIKRFEIGVDFDSYGNTIPVYLVTEIISCDKTFLKYGYEYDRDNNNQKIAGSEPEEINGGKSDPGTETKKLKIHSGKNSSGSAGKVIYKVDTSKKFPNDTPEENIVKHTKEDQQYTTINVIFSDDPYDEHSFQEESSKDSKVSKAKIEGRENKDTKAYLTRAQYEKYFFGLLELFEDYIDESGTGDEKMFQLISVNSDHAMYFKAEEWNEVLEDQNQKNFARDRYHKENSRRDEKYDGDRKALVVHIQHNMKYYTILDILPRINRREGRPFLYLLHKPDFKQISEEKLNELFLSFCKKLSLFSKEDDLTDLNFTPYKHVSEVENLFNTIKSDITANKHLINAIH